MRLDALIGTRRKQRGLSIREVAKRAKISPSGVYGLETGATKDPSCSTMVGVARALKLSPVAVFEAARESLEGNSAPAVDAKPIEDET